MTQPLLVFVATYISVFTLGLQSLNVNGGHYLAAAVTSFFIGTGHILLYRYMPGAALAELAGYYLGGIVGITSSIWFHQRAKAWLARRRDRRAAAVSAASLRAARFDEHADVEHCGYVPRRMGGTEPPTSPPRFP